MPYEGNHRTLFDSADQFLAGPAHCVAGRNDGRCAQFGGLWKGMLDRAVRSWTEAPGRSVTQGRFRNRLPGTPCAVDAETSKLGGRGIDLNDDRGTGELATDWHGFTRIRRVECLMGCPGDGFGEDAAWDVYHGNHQGGRGNAFRESGNQRSFR